MTKVLLLLSGGSGVVVGVQVAVVRCGVVVESLETLSSHTARIGMESLRCLHAERL